jgi:hypothetical protein
LKKLKLTRLSQGENMLPNEVKDYSESYQYVWKHKENYQEFRFQVMNMWVPDYVVDHSTV